MPRPHQPRGDAHREAGASVLSVLLVFVVAAAVGFGGGFAAHRARSSTVLELPLAPPGSSTSVAATTSAPVSTLGLGTTEVPTTTEAPPVETTEAPVVTDPPPPQIDLGTSGALFSSSAERRQYSDALGCDSFTETQTEGSSQGCDRFTVGAANVAWNVDSENDALDILWNDPATEPDIWNLALRADAAAIQRDPRVGDVTGDGSDDIVVGASTDGGLSVDVLEVGGSGPQVSLHLDLPGGRVRLGAGELHVWRSVEGNSEDLQHLVLAKSGGSWAVTSQELVAARNVGPSQV